jgi:hypothetical protein
MNMDQERPSGPAHRPSVPELRVLITLGPETMERSKESRLPSSTSPSAITSREPYALSYLLPIHLLLVSHSSFLSPIVRTLDPGRVTKIRLVRFIAWIDSGLAPTEASPLLSLICLPLFSHSRLVCQRAIVLPIRTRVHSLVSLSPRVAFPFMPHSYALYPDDSRVMVTHPLCSLYAIGPCPLVTCDVTRSVPSIYRQSP